MIEDSQLLSLGADAAAEVAEFVEMVLTPRQNLRNIPKRVCALLSCWLGRWIFSNIFSRGFHLWWIKLMAYGTVRSLLVDGGDTP